MVRKKKNLINYRARSSIYPFNKDETKILNHLSSISKNVYNCSIFCTDIYYRYKKKIFLELYNKIANKQIKNQSQFYKLLYELYESYYKHFCEINSTLQYNNTVIYEEITNLLGPTFVRNDNFFQHKQFLISILMNGNVIYLEEHRKELLDDIVEQILKSFYNRSYFKIQNQMLNNEPITILDGKLINDVKNNAYLFAKDRQNDPKKRINNTTIFKKKNAKKVLSDQAIISCFTYWHLNGNLEKMASDLVQGTIKKSFENYRSYFELRKKGIKANKPKYLPKNSHFNLIFKGNGIKEIKEEISNHKHIRLTVGSYTAQNYKDIIKNNTLVALNKGNFIKYIEQKELKNKEKGVLRKDNFIVGDKYIEKSNSLIQDPNYIMVKKPSSIDKTLTYVEIKPVYDGYKHKVCYTYDSEIKKVKDRSDIRDVDCISIDLGMKNLIAVYDPMGIPILIKGAYISSINKYFNHKIDRMKSEVKRKNNQNTSKKIRDQLIKRDRTIDRYFTLIARYLITKYKAKQKIIIGYNKGWKTGVNMGKKNNRKFYAIPYLKLLKKIRQQAEKYGIVVVETNEAYTSKCDALGMEAIHKHSIYKGTRTNRGLFLSSVHKKLNADVNGAINIMRKHFDTIGRPIRIIRGFRLCNPINVNIFHEVMVDQ